MRLPLRHSRACLCAGMLVAVTLALQDPAAAGPKPKKPRYFLIFREVLEAPGVVTGLKDSVKPLLVEALRQYPEIVLELPDAPQDPEALDAYLKKRGLKGYEINIRLTKLVKELKEARPGERRKVLAVTVGVSIFGTSFPGKSFAIGGDGESTVEIRVLKETPKDVDALKHDALKDALEQAIPKTLRTLEAGPTKPTPEKGRKRK